MTIVMLDGDIKTIEDTYGLNAAAYYGILNKYGKITVYQTTGKGEVIHSDEIMYIKDEIQR